MKTDTPSTGKNLPSTSVENIFRLIRERICLNDYPPGETLSENVLAEEFGVSRTPIRTALQRLEYEGLVVVRRGIGTIITPLDLKTLKEVYALRMKLAELIGELQPVARPTKESIEELECLLEKVRAMREGGEVRELARLNIAMHEARQQLIGNKPLREMFDSLYYRTARIWLQFLGDLLWHEEVDSMSEEIVQTIQALRANDMCAVGLIRRNGISLSLGRMTRYLNSAGD